MFIIGISCPCESNDIYKDYSKFLALLNCPYGAVRGYLELASIYVFPEVLNSHYKVPETA